mgnify:CR=1 FL=1
MEPIVRKSKKTGRLTAALAPALLLAVLAGCQDMRPLPDGLTPPQRQFEASWRASLAAMDEYRFPVAEQDRRRGVIVSEAVVSQHPTEFWRKDALTPADLFETALHTIYRQVRVELAPIEDGFQPEVAVSVFRSNRRSPQVTSTSQAYDLFSGTAWRELSVEYGPEEEAPGRVALGRDAELEAAILSEIEDRKSRLLAGE